jgi:hypothetical protein
MNYHPVIRRYIIRKMNAYLSGLPKFLYHFEISIVISTRNQKLI